MLERIKELNEKEYSVNEIANLVDLEPSVIESILNEELYTINSSNVKKFYDLIELDSELECLLDDIALSSITYSQKQNAVMIANEPVQIRISKTGSMYFMLGDLYLKGTLRNKVMKLVVENQLDELEELTELPKYIVKLMKSKFSNREYVVWFNKSLEPVMAMVKEQGLKRLENQMKNIEYGSLKEELSYVHKIEKEPIYNDEKDEIYGDKPENFVSREAELKELLQVILDIRGSGRKLFPEEILLLREIQSEISNVIGE